MKLATDATVSWLSTAARCLRDDGGNPGRGGQRGEPGPVKVEDLGRAGARERPAVAGHAQDRVHAEVTQGRQLLFEGHPVPVPAGQGDPRPHAGVLQQRRQQRGREVGVALVIPDKHGVRRRCQDGGH
jgi:hypothetical protein